MIVVDTNIIAYLLINGEKTETVRKLLKKDPNWIAPILWRSEFRNVLATYLKSNFLSFTQAIFLIEKAETLMRNNEYQINSKDVLSLVSESGCSAYDAEFVALAKSTGIKLATTDKKLIQAFPQIAHSPDDFLGAPSST